MKTGNIPSLASCGEITSFPPCQFVSTKVVGIHSLYPTYWEASPRKGEATPLHHLKERYTGTLFKDGTVTVDSSDYN